MAGKESKEINTNHFRPLLWVATIFSLCQHLVKGRSKPRIKPQRAICEPPLCCQHIPAVWLTEARCSWAWPCHQALVNETWRSMKWATSCEFLTDMCFFLCLGCNLMDEAPAVLESSGWKLYAMYVAKLEKTQKNRRNTMISWNHKLSPSLS